jgi:hypothetical protein
VAWFSDSRLFANAFASPGRRHAARSIAILSAAALIMGLAQVPAHAASDTEVTASQADDEASLALAKAKKTGKPVELESLRSADTTTYINPDATRTMVATAGDTRVEQGGELVDIDPTLQANNGVLTPAATKSDVQISDGTGRPTFRRPRSTVLSPLSTQARTTSKLPRRITASICTSCWTMRPPSRRSTACRLLPRA